MSEDFYSVLGVDQDASEAEIEQAYREKAREYHPDVSDDPDAEEKFKKIQKAKEVLTDEEKRQMYDQVGHDRFEHAEKRGGVGGGGGGGARGAGGDPFGGGGPFGDMGDIFDQFFGGGGRGQSRGGQDLKTNLSIDLEDAYEGVEKEVTVRRPENCTDCDGTGHPPGSDDRTCPECNGQGQQTTVQQTPMGRVQQTQTCRRCEGDGRLYDETCSTCRGDGITRERATLAVDIPAGIKDGQTIRMSGEGAPAEGRGHNGDLLIEVSVRDHDEFDREDDDLHYSHPISFPQAVFGDELEVPTMDGSANFDLPEGTQSGETFRLHGKGMPKLRGRGNGDMYVHVQVVTPDSLNGEQREALEAYAEAGGEEVDVDPGFFERLTSSI